MPSGRVDDNFPDENQNLIDELVAKYHQLSTLEMETFHLYAFSRTFLAFTE